MIWRSALSLVLAVVLALVSQTGAVARAQAGVPGLEMVLCTGSGTVTVTLDAEGNPTGPRHPCPDCLAALAPFLPPAAPVLHRPATTGRSILPPGQPVAIPRPAPAPLARAPPLRA
ncbi:MAG: hypothetical protein KF887_05960 [Paracoccaceae bacterium]|nr:MAG: hypothetical protein KF887_05960 [Paracoccaceae bacterium]